MMMSNSIDLRQYSTGCADFQNFLVDRRIIYSSFVISETPNFRKKISEKREILACKFSWKLAVLIK
jgi:hypothetical protein